MNTDCTAFGVYISDEYFWAKGYKEKLTTLYLVRSTASTLRIKKFTEATRVRNITQYLQTTLYNDDAYIPTVKKNYH